MAFRTHNFSLRLTSQETANYERLAKDIGVPVSEWMRNVLNAEVRYKEVETTIVRYPTWFGRYRELEQLAKEEEER